LVAGAERKSDNFEILASQTDLGALQPPNLDPRWNIFFAIDTLGVKLSGNMKNGPRSLFSFRDMKAQTSMRSKSRKISQKSAKSKNAHFPRKFISD